MDNNELNGRYFITELELKQLAHEFKCDIRDLCRVCGKFITIQIFKGEGYCCDKHRKLISGDDPSAYPFKGNPNVGAP